MNSLDVVNRYGMLNTFLNKELGVNVPDIEYYSKIAVWQSWYSGFVEDFHKTRVANGINIVNREIYQLNMAKRVCEDWSSALLAEGLEIKIADDKNKSSVFVKGSKGSGGVLGSNDFNDILSNALESAYALGTSAIVLGVENIGVDDSDNIIDTSNRSLALHWYDAMSILPLSWCKNRITECAFLSDIVIKGEHNTLLNVHLTSPTGYVIMNFAVDNEGKKLDAESLGLVPYLETQSKVPYFAIIRPNIVNNKSKITPMGISVYANAIDNLKGCDQCFDAAIREVITGQRIIFFNKTLLMMDEDGKSIVPNDVKQSYMQFFGDDISSDVKEFIKEFHPTLNTDKLDAELQNELNLLSMKCGLGAHYYNFESTGNITATEYIGGRQDFQRNARKNCSYLTYAVKSLIKAILSAGKVFLKANVNPDIKIAVSIPDNIIVDDMAIREQDRIDVEKGLLSRAEYRAKWYNETLETAQAAIKVIDSNEAGSEE